MTGLRVLDLFSAAAGGWSLGLHRAGFQTVAACEYVAWRRALYAQNNPGVRIYDDVRTLTAERIISDLGYLPEVIVGSPPCQDISSANTGGRGVEGERSSLYFEAIRLVGECRPRWFAFENSANLRTRGADAVLAALEGIGYACWPFVVRASDIGANHERARSWIIGYDAHADDKGEFRREVDAADSNEARQSHGQVESGLRPEEIAGGGCGNGRCDDWPGAGQVADGAPDCGAAGRSGAVWSLANLADHLRLDDGLSVRLAGTRIDLGNRRRASAASLIVEAFGDAVVPQIPEAIGRAILRVEAALASETGRQKA